MLSWNNQPPPITIRLNTMKTKIEDAHHLQAQLLKDERNHSDRRPLRSAIRLKDQPRFATPSLFASGFYTIQDEASQLIGYLVNPKADEAIADACAGPGGKLSHIYELSEGRSQIFAIEQDKDQMQKAKDTMQRLGHEKLDWIEDNFLNWTSPSGSK